MISESQRKAIEARAEKYAIAIEWRGDDYGVRKGSYQDCYRAGALSQAELDAEAVKVLLDGIGSAIEHELYHGVNACNCGDVETILDAALKKYDALRGEN